MSPRLLLVRTSALGDVVHALPVLTALRRQLPEAHIGWVVEAASAPLVAGHPDLDETIVVRLRQWRRHPAASATRREVAAALGALRRFRADAVLDLMGNHKAGIIARAAGGRRVIGLARRHRREPASAVWLGEAVEPLGPHAVDHALSLLPALGVAVEPADFGGDKLLRPEPRTVGQRLAAAGVGERPFVLLHPGAGWHDKRWPVARWGAAAGRLERASGLPTVVATAPGEEELAARVVSAAGGAAVEVPAPDLPTLGALLRRSRLALGGDTGPIHLAHALGTPVLCLMGPTDPERNGPYGAPERALWQRLPCSFCYRRFAEPKACMLALTVERVVERALGILSLS